MSPSWNDPDMYEGEELYESSAPKKRRGRDVEEDELEGGDTAEEIEADLDAEDDVAICPMCGALVEGFQCETCGYILPL